MDFTNSLNTGHGTAVFDADQAGMASVFINGNSLVPGCEGTYRNGSDAISGLVFDNLNTPGPITCDSAANTGWIGSNSVGNANSYRALTFRFNSFDPGDVFEFDCDTDGTPLVNGGGMSGLIITITTDNAGVFSGPLVSDPTVPSGDRSFIDF